MEREEGIKEGGAIRIGDEKKNTVAIKNELCNQTWEKYIRTDLLGLCWGRFSSAQTCLVSFICNLDLL